MARVGLAYKLGKKEKGKNKYRSYKEVGQIISLYILLDTRKKIYLLYKTYADGAKIRLRIRQHVSWNSLALPGVRRRWQPSRWQLPRGLNQGLSNICALAGYGDENNFISLASRPPPFPWRTTQMQDAETPASNRTSTEANKKFPHALRLFTSTYTIVYRRFGDNTILSYLHVTLVFIYHLTFCPDAIAHVAPHLPWKLTALMLNPLVSFSSSSAEQQHNGSNLLESEGFPAIREVRKGEDEDVEVTKTTKEESSAGNGGQENTKSLKLDLARRGRRPLPDDYAMRGFPWVERYFPGNWFNTDKRVDDDDKYLELASMILERRNRLLWLGTRMFGVNPAYEVELDLQLPEMPPIPSQSVDMDIEDLPDAGSVA
ncbi:hypothetical protein MYCTH_95813 [Thermothelomyces thermophilus ATCC 42464]|uniref:Uncharacterized protein n=1 Tax=Thermothelomyces thermophilus (strain ATCC 42464 / BCRC 31852 / DSM 1799) TaxID=573729 RepID=G2QKG7_THET4|nr:uncharacterized protein MYCTH_95813 [Thermothelomyces thermophilus ATCC 42464]AEO60073.1 hypothetical protein MYCTH_95813 [Thermothelomyces thermophilus ATCC 42464]